MHMFTNRKYLITLLFLSFIILSCTKNNKFSFPGILGNISSTPEEYLNNENFQCIKITREAKSFPKYAVSYGCKTILRVSNENIQITYWEIDNQYQIQTILINKKTSLNSLSSFIGKSTDEVIKSIDKETSYELTASELRINIENYKYFIIFKHKNKKIYQIVIGKNL